MAPLDTEAQFKFLIACIRHSTAGKVSNQLPIIIKSFNQSLWKIDFENVAKECDIVSKGAA